MPTITTGDIARRIKGENEDLASVVDRVRNWVKHGLLTPVGERNPGIGKHRSFSERNIVEAGVLNLLSRDYGSDWSKLALFKSALDLAVKELPKAKHVPDWQDIWLVTGPTEGIESPSKPGQILSVIRYVDAARSRPVSAGPFKRILELPDLIGSRLLAVNLSDLFRKIGVPLREFEELRRLAKKFPGADRLLRG